MSMSLIVWALVAIGLAAFIVAILVEIRWKSLKVLQNFMIATTVITFMTVLGILAYKDGALRKSQIAQINGAWVSLDNSVRYHFMVDHKDTDLNYTYVVISDLKSGTARIIPYATEEIGWTSIKFSAKTEYMAPIPSPFPEHFVVSGFSDINIRIDTGNESSLYIKGTQPETISDLANYVNKYSLEEYLAVVVGMLIDNDYTQHFYSGEDTELWIDIQPSFVVDGSYASLIVNDIRMQIGESGILLPGRNCAKMITTLQEILLPLGNENIDISCTEEIGAENGKAIWTGKYLLDSQVPNIITDTATGKKIVIIRK